MVLLAARLLIVALVLLSFGTACNAGSSSKEPSGTTGAAESTQSPTTQKSTAEGKSQQGKSQQDLKAGDTTLFDNGDTIAVYSYVSPVQPTNSAFAPHAGMQYAAIDVEGCAGVHTESPMPLNMFFFALGMPDNTRLQPTVSVAEPALNSANVSPGDCLRGYVSFEVPQDQRPRDVILTSPGITSSVKWAIA